KALREDVDPRVKRAAAYALGTFGPLAAGSIPALKEALRNKNPGVRQNAAWALGRIRDRVDGTCVAELCDLLRDPDVLVRRDAAGALGELGQSKDKDPVRAAARPLIDLVRTDRDDVVRKTGLDALARLTTPAHQEPARDLFPLLESKDPELAHGAALVL